MADLAFAFAMGVLWGAAAAMAFNSFRRKD
jgi:hypothetical protein